MTVRVRVLGNPRVCTQRVRVQVHFCTCDLNLNRVEPDLGAGFIFHSRVHPKSKKNPETQKKTEKTQNSKET
jgi:hypothetical protein